MSGTRSKALHRCSVPDCFSNVLPTVVFCEHHARMLTDDTSALIGRVFKPHRPPSMRFVTALRVALREIAYFRAKGYREPRNQELEL